MEIKVYLYDSTKTDYKGADYSPYLLSGMQDTEDITRELDSTEITLMGIDKAERFTAGTKFIIDIVENGAIVRTYHRVVKEDVTSKPILEKMITISTKSLYLSRVFWRNIGLSTISLALINLKM